MAQIEAVHVPLATDLAVSGHTVDQQEGEYVATEAQREKLARGERKTKGDLRANIAVILLLPLETPRRHSPHGLAAQMRHAPANRHIM